MDSSESWQVKFSKLLESFLRSFGEPTHSRSWLTTLCTLGQTFWESPRATAVAEAYLERVASYATEPIETRPWKSHPEIRIVMQSAHHAGLAIAQAAWRTTAKPATPANATDQQVIAYLEDNHDTLIAAFTPLADQADYTEWLRLAAKIGIERARVVAALSNADASRRDFVATPLQTEILKALDGRAMGLENLAVAVSNGDSSRLYRAGALKELRDIGLVEHKRSLGYYRPDFPPQNKLAVNSH